jgi:hypothetical protein
MPSKLATLSSLALGSFLFFGCGSSGGNGNSLGNNDTHASATIGPDGGTVDDGNGLKITIPAGALTGNVQISAGRTSTAGPSSNGALSNLYQFGPEGTTFRQPVTVTLPLPPGAPPNVTIFWSQSGSSTYEDINATVTGSSITATVTHFSTGFVGTLLSMSNWVHVAHANWAYWVPNNNWRDAYNDNGIDISSPIGDADVSFGFAYGPLVPTTLDAAESSLRQQLFTNFTVINQSPITPGPYYGGSSRTTEFTASSLFLHGNVHGKLTVDIGPQVFDAYLWMSTTATWSSYSATLQLIRDHIVHCGAGLCGP